MDLVSRILSDPGAALITALLLLVQIIGAIWAGSITFGPRKRQRRELIQAAATIAKNDLATVLSSSKFPVEVHRALNRAYNIEENDEVAEPELAFQPDFLLPLAYNGRIDAAAPGLFTAVGILGTFFGLIFAFSHINFSNAAESIEPLISGMLTAFINSLMGVGLSIAWTLSSRTSRHSFDTAAASLRWIVETRFGRPAHGSQVLQSLSRLNDQIATVVGFAERTATSLQELSAEQRHGTTQIVSELTTVRSAVSESSAELLRSLAPKLEESFKSLVDMPFARLSTSVDQFRTILQDISASHARTLAALDESAQRLSTAHAGLGSAVGEAERFVKTFAAASEQLQQQVTAAATIVNESRQAAIALKSSASSIEAASSTHGVLAEALKAGVGELERTAESLGSASREFSAAAGRLETAVTSIQSIGPDTAQASIAALQQELEGTIGRMGEALAAFGARSMSAYEQSTARVVKVVDERTSDLTDRISAELSTLAQRLPEATTEIGTSVKAMNIQLKHAVSTLQQGVRTLDASTNETLAGRLKSYDEMVASAVDHFNGTLMTWGGKVNELTQVVTQLKDAVLQHHSLLTPPPASNDVKGLS